MTAALVNLFYILYSLVINSRPGKCLNFLLGSLFSSILHDDISYRPFFFPWLCNQCKYNRAAYLLTYLPGPNQSKSLRLYPLHSCVHHFF